MPETGRKSLRCATVQLISYLTPGIPAELFETLARVIDAELVLRSDVSGPTAADDPFRRHEYDLGWMCSTSYVDLTRDAADPSVALIGVGWVPDDPDAAGRPVYFGDVVVGPDSAVHSLEELAGAAIGCNDPVSLSGYQALLIELRDRGHDPDTWADLRFTGGHHTSLDQVLSGELDAAVVDSVVRLGRSRHDDAVAGLRIVQRIGPWPTQPIVARADLAEIDARTIRSQLLRAAADPEIRSVLDAAGIADLVPVDVEDYERLRSSMEAYGFL